MALRTKVNAFFVLHMAVRAVELILIMGRRVGVCAFHVFGFLDEVLSVVTLSAGFDSHFFRIGFIGTVAHLTSKA